MTTSTSVFFKTMEALEVYSSNDYYPGTPYYIGKKSEDKASDDIYYYHLLYTAEKVINKITEDARWEIFSKPIEDIAKISLKLSDRIKELENFLDSLEYLKFQVSERAAKQDDVRLLVEWIKQCYEGDIPEEGEVTPLFIGDLIRDAKRRLHYIGSLRTSLVIL